MATSRPITLRQGHVPFQINNENQSSGKQQMTGASGKTPVNNTKRRAFGDISNRKVDRNQTTAEKGSAIVKNDSTVKKSSHLNGKVIDVQVKDAKGKNLQPKTISKRKVNFNLPSEQSTAATRTIDFELKGKHDSVAAWKDINQNDLDDSLEIEQAAGRTWDQQWSNGDHDSSISDCSLEGLDTVIEDHKKVRDVISNCIQLVRQKEIDEEDRYYEEMKTRWDKPDDAEKTFENFEFLDISSPTVSDHSHDKWSLDIVDDIQFDDISLGLPSL